MFTKNLNAEIITIGDEILIGQIVDTNSAWIAQQLNQIGINIYQITSISDTKDHILNALNEAAFRVDLIIVTGGLGPTNDDITKLTIVEYFDSKLIRNQDVLEHITKRMTERHISMNKLNVQQADVPDNCIVIPNHYGTAPGMWFEKDEKTYLFLPGVPMEMKGIFSEQLIPKLKDHFNNLSIFHKTIVLYGIPESELALLIEPWEKQLPSAIKLAYLPSYGILRLRLTIKGDHLEKLKQIVSIEIDKILPILQPYLLSENDEPVEMIIYKLLKENNLTVSVAESCTGGKIASLLTSIPGSSSYFKGGVVAYSNEVKENILKVDSDLIEKYGAVSEEVVKEMSKNVRELFLTQYAISVSGIAGPDGGTPEKPVGTTWISVSSKNKIIVKKFLLGKSREQNIQRASTIALIELRKLVLLEKSKE